MMITVTVDLLSF